MGKMRKTTCAQGKAQKRPEITFIPQTDSQDRDSP